MKGDNKSIEGERVGVCFVPGIDDKIACAVDEESSWDTSVAFCPGRVGLVNGIDFVVGKEDSG